MRQKYPANASNNDIPLHLCVKMLKTAADSIFASSRLSDSGVRSFSIQRAQLSQSLEQANSICKCLQIYNPMFVRFHLLLFLTAIPIPWHLKERHSLAPQNDFPPPLQETTTIQ